MTETKASLNLRISGAEGLLLLADTAPFWKGATLPGLEQAMMAASPGTKYFESSVNQGSVRETFLGPQLPSIRGSASDKPHQIFTFEA